MAKLHNVRPSNGRLLCAKMNLTFNHSLVYRKFSIGLGNNVLCCNRKRDVNRRIHCRRESRQSAIVRDPSLDSGDCCLQVSQLALVTWWKFQYDTHMPSFAGYSSLTWEKGTRNQDHMYISTHAQTNWDIVGLHLHACVVKPYLRLEVRLRDRVTFLTRRRRLDPRHLD
jgi:hypothetical protein